MNQNVLVAAAALAAAAVLAGCGGSSNASHAVNGGGTSCANPSPATVMNETLTDDIPTDFDPSANPQPQTTIAFSVLLPSRCPGERFPLVLHSHGYGGSRLTSEAANGDLKPNDPLFASMDELAQALPFHGYVVISFDERGHGQSKDANARIIDPAAETQDARAILDWAYDHAAQLQLVTEPDSGIPKDLKVGTIGGSYGGGFQLTLAALDARVDAIVPIATWHDLLYSLLPGDGVKLSFDGLLCLEASINQVANTPLVQTLCNTVGVQGPLADDMRTRSDLVNAVGLPTAQPRPVAESELISFFYTHGMGYFRAQQLAGQSWGSPPYAGASPPLRKIPALFFQGNRDVLFNLTEAYWNWRYFSENGGDARLISTEGGHMNPLANQSEGNADCGGVVGVNAALAWFDHYLKGKDTPDYAALPKLCISVADTVGAPNVPAVGVTLDRFPVGSLSGTGAVPAQLPTLSADVPLTATGPVFVPVATIHGSGQVLAGAPTLGSLTVTPGTGASPLHGINALVGVGIVRGGNTILVDDQVTAFTAGDHHDNRNVSEDPRILLPAVGERLQDGDQVGLLFYPQHIQYAAVVSAAGLSGATGIVSLLAGQPIPPITSALNPVLGIPYDNPYSVTASDVELPIFIPGQYPGSALTQPAN